MRRLTRAFSAPFDERIDPEANKAAARDLASLLLEVANRFTIEGVEGGVDLILDGRLQGFDGKRLPTPTQLALAIRQALAERPVSKHRRVPEALAAPDIEHDADSRARVKARVEAFISAQQGRQAEDAAEAGERQRGLAERVAQRFDPPQDSASLNERLARRRENAGAVR